VDAGTVFVGLGVASTGASFIMKRMVPLRALALASNSCFIGYGFAAGVLGSILVNAVLVPINAKRLWEIKKLSKEIARATQESPISEWLLPHMRRRSFKQGEVLFRKGDAADKLIYIAEGCLKLTCETDGKLYEMTDEMIFQLYCQHPKLRFFIMRLVA
jgi:CRP/FNR family cyclic AMP-dependent transcriptional regulator